MFCQWFNPLEHLSAISGVNSHPVHGLIHEGTRYKLSRWLICRKRFMYVGIIQWSVRFNPLEHLSATSEVNSHPFYGLIHESTRYKLSRCLSVENFSHAVGLIQCSVNGLIHWNICLQVHRIQKLTLTLSMV